MGLSEYIQGIQQASVVIVRDTENWFLLMQRISCSTLNFLEIVKILTVSLRMSPDTLRRRLISVASIWDLILSVTCQKPVTRGWQLECKCRGKGRALPSGCAPSSPQHSGTTKPPPRQKNVWLRGNFVITATPQRPVAQHDARRPEKQFSYSTIRKGAAEKWPTSTSRERSELEPPAVLSHLFCSRVEL